MILPRCIRVTAIGCRHPRRAHRELGTGCEAACDCHVPALQTDAILRDGGRLQCRQQQPAGVAASSMQPGINLAPRVIVMLQGADPGWQACMPTHKITKQSAHRMQPSNLFTRRAPPDLCFSLRHRNRPGRQGRPWLSARQHLRLARSRTCTRCLSIQSTSSCGSMGDLNAARLG